jgi:hypothetical protein
LENTHLKGLELANVLNKKPMGKDTCVADGAGVTVNGVTYGRTVLMHVRMISTKAKSAIFPGHTALMQWRMQMLGLKVATRRYLALLLNSFRMIGQSRRADAPVKMSTILAAHAFHGVDQPRGVLFHISVLPNTLTRHILVKPGRIVVDSSVAYVMGQRMAKIMGITVIPGETMTPNPGAMSTKAVPLPIDPRIN